MKLLESGRVGAEIVAPGAEVVESLRSGSGLVEPDCATLFKRHWTLSSYASLLSSGDMSLLMKTEEEIVGSTASCRFLATVSKLTTSSELCKVTRSFS